MILLFLEGSLFSVASVLASTLTCLERGPATFVHFTLHGSGGFGEPKRTGSGSQCMRFSESGSPI